MSASWELGLQAIGGASYSSRSLQFCLFIDDAAVAATFSSRGNLDFNVLSMILPLAKALLSRGGANYSRSRRIRALMIGKP